MGESRGHFTRRVRLGTLIAGLGPALALTAVPAAAAPALYRAGFGQRSINPDNGDGTWGPNHETVYLGGFGLGSPNGATIATGDRHATGILGRGADVRAFAVSDGKGHTFALADIQTQGWFVATNNGPYGLVDMRKK